MSVSLIALGLYFLMVAHENNASAFYSSIAQDKMFGLWLLALGLAYLLYRVPNMPGVVDTLLALALFALLIRSWPNVTAQASDLYHTLGG